MGAPARFPSGVTNVGPTDPLAQYGLPDPSKWHTYFNDFDKYAAADWVVTTTEAGAGSATEVIGDVDGGALVLTNAAGDDDRDFLQLAGETFKFEAGKKLAFKARLKVSDATQSDFVIGLQITDTTPLDVTDGVFFQKDDGDANLDVHVEKDGTATSQAAVHTMVDDTFVVVALYYDGVDEIGVYIDGSRVAALATTNLPDDEELTVSFGIQNGEAVAKVMTLDYVLVAKER